MEFFHPEQCVSNQKVHYFFSAIIKDIGTPVRMLSPAAVSILIQRQSVKTPQTMLVLRKMCRYPVQDYLDPSFMQFIHKIHKVFWCTISAGRCIIAPHLVSPGTIKRILCDSHQFHMGIPHIHYIISQHRCQFPVAVIAIIVIFNALFPGGQMHFIDVHRHAVPLFRPDAVSFLHKGTVLPFVSAQVCDPGSIARTHFRIIAIRIRLHNLTAISGRDLILINGPFPGSRYKQFKNTAFSVKHHLVQAGIPHIEIPHYTDTAGIRCPHGKTGSLHAGYFLPVCA